MSRWPRSHPVGTRALRRSPPGGPRGLCFPQPKAGPYRGQDVPTAAVEHEALAVEGDHVALSIEGAGGRTAGTLPARPFPPEAGAGERGGLSGGCRGTRAARAFPLDLDLGGLDPRDSPRPPGAPGEGCGLPCLAVSVELGAPGVRDSRELARTLLGGYTLPAGILIEPLGADTAGLALGRYLQGEGQWPLGGWLYLLLLSPQLTACCCRPPPPSCLAARATPDPLSPLWAPATLITG